MAVPRIVLMGDRRAAVALVPFAISKWRLMVKRMRPEQLVLKKNLRLPTGDWMILQQTSGIGGVYIFGAGGISYDFFTSEEIAVIGSPPGPQTPPATDPPAVDGQFHIARLRGRSAKCTQGGTNFRDYPIAEDAVPTYRSWQRQKFHERPWFQGNGRKAMVMSAQGVHYQNEFDFNDSMLSGAVTRTRLIDKGAFDIPPTAYLRDGKQITAAPYFGDDLDARVPDANGEDEWWRDAAYRVVNGKPFIFMFDWYGELSMFPAEDKWPGGNPSTVVKKPIPWPSWVSMDATVSKRLASWNTWKFDQNAAKAIIVVTKRVNSELGDGTDIYINDVGNVFWIEEPNQSVPPDRRAQEDLTGVVEISIDPSYDPLTGVFDFNLTVAHEQQDDEKFYVAADYAFGTNARRVATVEAFALNGVTGGPDYPDDFGVADVFYDLVVEDSLDSAVTESLRRTIYYAKKFSFSRTSTTVPSRTGTYLYRFQIDANIVNYADGDTVEYILQMRSLDLRANALHAYESVMTRRAGVFDIRGAKRYEAHGQVVREFITESFDVPVRTPSWQKYELPLYHDSRWTWNATCWNPLVNQIQVHPLQKAWSVCSFNFEVGQGEWDPILGFANPAIEDRFDIVSNQGVNTTHKALYNIAHPDEERDYDHWPPPDLGQMATAGIWRL